MSAKSDYLETAMINAVLRNTTFTSPAIVYAALFTTDPAEDASGAEVSGGSYARQSTAFDAPSPAGETQNTADVTFPTATAAWGTVTHFAIFDAASAGNMLYYGSLTVSKIVGNGDTFKFVAGAVEIAEN
jgi:hypothetical protein